MKNGMGGGNNNSGGGNGGGGGGNGNNGGIPPELMEALTEALNDDEFKKTLEQIGKEVGKDNGKVRRRSCVCRDSVVSTQSVRLCLAFFAFTRCAATPEDPIVV